MSLMLEKATVRRNGRAILGDVSLAACPGEVLAIVGPNGAGKSTALAVASGVLRPNEGRVTLDGLSIASYGSQALARRRAVVPQSAQVAFPFRVHEVVAFGRAPHRGTSPASDEGHIVGEALARFDLLQLADRDVTTLSGGERQRVNLARAFAQVWRAPADGADRWLLLDEPTAALDPAHQIATLSAAADFARAGGGVIVILHDLRLAATYADRVAMLRNGQLEAIGTPAAVLTPQRVGGVFGLAETDVRLFVAAEHSQGSCSSPTPTARHDRASSPSAAQAAELL